MFSYFPRNPLLYKIFQRSCHFLWKNARRQFCKGHHLSASSRAAPRCSPRISWRHRRSTMGSRARSACVDREELAGLLGVPARHPAAGLRRCRLRGDLLRWGRWRRWPPDGGGDLCASVRWVTYPPGMSNRIYYRVQFQSPPSELQIPFPSPLPTPACASTVRRCWPFWFGVSMCCVSWTQTQRERQRVRGHHQIDSRYVRL